VYRGDSVVTRGGLFYRADGTEGWARVDTGRTGLKNDFINDLLFDGTTLWAATDGGLYARRENRWHRERPDTSLGIACDSMRVAVLTPTTVMEMVRSNDAWRTLPRGRLQEPETADQPRHYRIQYLLSGDLAFCTNNGVAVYRRSKDRWFSLLQGQCQLADIPDYGLWGVCNGTFYRLETAGDTIVTRELPDVQVFLQRKVARFGKTEKPVLAGERWMDY
jgi:hypothetical protein